MPVMNSLGRAIRIVTWNACRGSIDAKRAQLALLEPDITVLQEVAAPRAPQPGVEWFGIDPKLGVAVIARPPFGVSPLPAEERVAAHVAPFRISGPLAFTLLAVWTRRREPLPYVRAAVAAIDSYASLLQAGPAAMVGDFNANAKWDGMHPPQQNFSAMVAGLRRYAMESSYHHFHAEAFGSESRSTFFQHRRAERGHHIDYCFLPRKWMRRLGAVEVGSPGDWLGASDHCPVWVDVMP